MSSGTSVPVSPQPSAGMDVLVRLRPICNWLLLLRIRVQGHVRRVFGRIISEYRKVYCNGFYTQRIITKSVKLLRKLERQRLSSKVVSWFILESREFLSFLTVSEFNSSSGFNKPSRERSKQWHQFKKKMWQKEIPKDDGYETEDEVEEVWRFAAQKLEDAKSRNLSRERIVISFRAILPEMLYRILKVTFFVLVFKAIMAVGVHLQKIDPEKVFFSKAFCLAATMELFDPKNVLY